MAAWVIAQLATLLDLGHWAWRPRPSLFFATLVLL
jgi:hypothetical protein